MNTARTYGSGACKYGLDSLDTMPVLLSNFYRIHNTFLPESYCLIPSEFFVSLIARLPFSLIV